MDYRLDEAFKKIFPNSEPYILVALEDGSNVKTWAIPNENEIIKKVYGINDETNFIQYTSIDSLFAIINSCHLRLYNLFTLNDPSELKFALSEFGLKLLEEDYYRLKQEMFIASFCGYNPTKQNEDYNMWRFYGKDGYGAALVFEIQNYNSKWSNYAFGKVQYGYDNNAFDKLKQITAYYHSDFGASFPQLIPLMCMLHKHQVWEIENEYRLFANYSYNDKTFIESLSVSNYFLSSTLNHYITDKGDKGAFTCLPFYTDTLQKEMKLQLKNYHIEGYYEMFPHLKLKRVIIGYNVSQSKTNQIIDFGSRLTIAKLGYPVEFIESKFRKEFK